MTYPPAPMSPPPMPPMPGQRPPKKPMSPGAIIAIVLGGVVLLGCGICGVVAVAMPSPSKRTSATRVQTAQTATYATPTATPTTAPATRAAPAGPQTAPAGTAVNVAAGSNQLVVTVAAPQGGVDSGNRFVTPKKGQFFVVTATVEFKSGGSTYFADSGDFKLVTADGAVYGSEFFNFIDPVFESMRIQAGQKVTGKVAFDVPSSVKAGAGAKIQFDGSYAKAAAYWTI